MKKQKFKSTVWLLAAALMFFIGLPAQLYAQEKTPAFPGAEGFGRYTTGGRGGTVYHVKNLNDSGEGSLRWALGQTGKKIIVFDISGTIHLESELEITSNTTIAGQSAPGDGICVADYPVSIKGNNVIVRYMRFRLGNKHVTKDGADGWDGFGGFDHSDLIIDHCSVSWSIDECLSVLGNKNTTVQWCLVAQSLVNAGHTKGDHGYGGNWGGSGASFHHNLLAHHGSRTPRLGPRPTTQLDERMDMRNNVIYNFGNLGCYGGEGMTVNIVNNYYKPGPGSPTNTRGYRIAGVGVRTTEYVTKYPDYAPALHLWGKYYVTGNHNTKYSNVNNDNWTYGIINQVDANDCDGTFTDKTKDTIKLESPMPFVVTTTHSAADAFNRVLDYAGASLSRDEFDALMISDTRDGIATYTGSGLSKGFVNSQDDNKPSNASSDWSAWPTLNSTAAPVDTDGDGMPDDYETKNGLNPNDATDGAAIAENGYTNVENYLNSLVEEITNAQNEGGTLEGYTKNVGDDPVVTEYEISPMTNEDTNGSTWNFSGDFVVSNTGGKTYSTGTGGGITGVKYSNNVSYTITIPSDISIKAVGFTGYANEDADGYLYSLAGKSYTSADYVFPNRNKSATATHKIEFEKSVSGSISFKFVKQMVMNIKLYVDTTTGIDEIVDSSANVGNGKIYNLQGMEVDNTLQKGIYIKNGRKFVVK